MIRPIRARTESQASYFAIERTIDRIDETNSTYATIVKICAKGNLGTNLGTDGMFPASLSTADSPDPTHPEPPPRMPACPPAFHLSSPKTPKSLHPQHFHLPIINPFKRTMVP